MSAPNSVPTSAVTASKSCADGALRAISVATRRNAACSSVRRRASVRDSAFEIAVAMSSVKAASLASVSSGSGSSAFEATIVTPQRRPSTTIGAPTDERMPCSRSTSTIGLDTPA
jgi:hypothetical protein